MPQPTIGDVHVNRPLTNISVAYLQNRNDFISNTAFPIIPVENKSDDYFVFDSADFRRNNVQARAPGTESAGGGFDLTTASYNCKVYALHTDLADQIVANADSPLNLERAAAEFVMQQLMIQKEVRWMTDYFATGIWGTDVVGTTDFTKWHDSSSDPESDIDLGKATIKQTIGLDANTLIVDYQTHQALKRHPAIIERYKHTTGNNITADILARYFEVERYLVSSASYTTSEEGASTEVNAFIAGQNALLCHVANSPALMTASAGYTFAWRKYAGSINGIRTKKFRMEELEAERIESGFAYDHKVVTANAGYFFSDTID